MTTSSPSSANTPFWNDAADRGFELVRHFLHGSLALGFRPLVLLDLRLRLAPGFFGEHDFDVVDGAGGLADFVLALGAGKFNRLPFRHALQRNDQRTQRPCDVERPEDCGSDEQHHGQEAKDHCVALRGSNDALDIVFFLRRSLSSNGDRAIERLLGLRRGRQRALGNDLLLPLLELPQLWRGGSCVCCELGIQIQDVGLKSGDFLGPGRILVDQTADFGEAGPILRIEALLRERIDKAVSDLGKLFHVIGGGLQRFLTGRETNIANADLQTP
jgi:hypothetical protein